MAQYRRWKKIKLPISYLCTSISAGSGKLQFCRAYTASSDHPAPLLSKLLVANRGEIACRILRTAKRMGIRTTAVYSEADVNAKHVMLADEAVCLGPPSVRESYLNVDKIIGAVKAVGAEAVHPGYGFLSENAAFVQRLEAEGITFVGPPASAIAAMGDKIQSKNIAVAAGVSTIPGVMDVVRDEGHAVEIAKRVGFPVMLKASAGGGGKGMRVARNVAETREGFRLSSQEAMSSFGDNRMFVERFIEDPRHIEIQIMGDKLGNMVFFPQRECSIQRRNQKVIEEAPSVNLPTEVVWEMGQQALSLARAVGYTSAGTLEFLVDKHHRFYFLEMNTRLQVEHPVTEMVTGLDLVEMMLRVASGQPLGISQERAFSRRGWAVECRVYAEDASNGFLPSIGRLTSYREPPQQPLVPVADTGRTAGNIGVGRTTDSQGAAVDTLMSATVTDIKASTTSLGMGDTTTTRPGTGRDGPSPGHDGIAGQGGCTVRVDSGMLDGSEVSIFYDPLIAKVITHGPDRQCAINAMKVALDSYVIRGVRHNIPFLRTLLDHKEFEAGNLTTKFLPQHFPQGFQGGQLSEANQKHLRTLACYLYVRKAMRDASYLGGDQRLASSPASPSPKQQAPRRVVVTLDGEDSLHVVEEIGRQNYSLQAAGAAAATGGDAQMRGDSQYHSTTEPVLTIDGRRVTLRTQPGDALAGTGALVVGEIDGCPHVCQITRRFPRGFDVMFAGAEKSLLVQSELQASIAHRMPPPAVQGASGTVKSPMAGRLVSVAVKEGQEVVPGDELVVIEAMKMQNVVRCMLRGTVASIKVKEGAVLSCDDTILHIEAS
eukprot:jgi/Mesvir1/14517/Mv05215-RA.1